MTYVIAEIGINHNGDMDLAKELIYDSFHAGCDAVKLQKRDIESVYTKEELDTGGPCGCDECSCKLGENA